MTITAHRILAAVLAALTLSAVGCTDGYQSRVSADESIVEPIVDDYIEPVDVPATNYANVERHFDIVSHEPDGSTVVEYSYNTFVPHTITLTSFQNGQEIEQNETRWATETRSVTVTVPNGKDITRYLNETNPISAPVPPTDEQLVYEVFEHGSDGSTVVLVPITNVETEIKTQTVDRGKRSVEQCYRVWRPTSVDLFRVHIPEGNDVLEYVDSFIVMATTPLEPVFEGVPALPVEEAPPAPPAW